MEVFVFPPKLVSVQPVGQDFDVLVVSIYSTILA